MLVNLAHSRRLNRRKQEPARSWLVRAVGVFAGRPHVQVVVVDLGLSRGTGLLVIEANLEEDANLGEPSWRRSPEALEVLLDVPTVHVYNLTVQESLCKLITQKTSL